MQIAEHLLRIRDSLSELSLLQKNYKTKQDIHESRSAFQFGQSVLDKLSQSDLFGLVACALKT